MFISDNASGVHPDVYLAAESQANMIFVEIPRELNDILIEEYPFLFWVKRRI